MSGAPCLSVVIPTLDRRRLLEQTLAALDRQRRAGRWARLAVATHPALRWQLVLQPIAFSAVVALRLALRWRRADLWDLRCRLAFARGYLSREPLGAGAET